MVLISGVECNVCLKTLTSSFIPTVSIKFGPHTIDYLSEVLLVRIE